MTDEPGKSASPTHPACVDESSRARQWFAEAREKSASDQAAVESWKSECETFGYCLANSTREWIAHGAQRDFYWRDKGQRQQGKPSRRFWESR